MLPTHQYLARRLDSLVPVSKDDINNSIAKGIAIIPAVASVGSAVKSATRTVVRVGELIPTHGKTMSNKKFDQLVKKTRKDGEVKEPLTVTEFDGKLYI
jgi:uncharacterized protein YpuA (DUF1002 family)